MTSQENFGFVSWKLKIRNVGDSPKNTFLDETFFPFFPTVQNQMTEHAAVISILHFWGIMWSCIKMNKIPNFPLNLGCLQVLTFFIRGEGRWPESYKNEVSTYFLILIIFFSKEFLEHGKMCWWKTSVFRSGCLLIHPWGGSNEAKTGPHAGHRLINVTSTFFTCFSLSYGLSCENEG